MGREIHSYIDYHYEINGHKIVDFLAKINIPRNKLLFSALVEGDECFDPVVEPRGVPKNLSNEIRKDYLIRVLDKNSNEIPRYNECSYKEAKNYEWFDDKFIINPQYHTASWLNVEELRRAQLLYSIYSCEQTDIILIEADEDLPYGYILSERYGYMGRPGSVVGEKIPDDLKKHDILQGVINLMEIVNKGDVNKTKFIFWFDN